MQKISSPQRLLGLLRAGLRRLGFKCLYDYIIVFMNGGIYQETKAICLECFKYEKQKVFGDIPINPFIQNQLNYNQFLAPISKGMPGILSKFRKYSDHTLQKHVYSYHKVPIPKKYDFLGQKQARNAPNKDNNDHQLNQKLLGQKQKEYGDEVLTTCSQSFYDIDFNILEELD